MKIYSIILDNQMTYVCKSNLNLNLGWSRDMNTEGRVSQGSYRFDNFWMFTPVINLLF